MFQYLQYIKLPHKTIVYSLVFQSIKSVSAQFFRFKDQKGIFFTLIYQKKAYLPSRSSDWVKKLLKNAMQLPTIAKILAIWSTIIYKNILQSPEYYVKVQLWYIKHYVSFSSATLSKLFKYLSRFHLYNKINIYYPLFVSLL